MCLYATRERDKGHAPLKATKAWKCVSSTRKPWYRSCSGVVYADGSSHRVSAKEIRDYRNESFGLGEYSKGLHVYRSLKEARMFASERAATFVPVVIEVRVSPRDWVASNARESVYRRLKVVGEVK